MKKVFALFLILVFCLQSCSFWGTTIYPCEYDNIKFVQIVRFEGFDENDNSAIYTTICQIEDVSDFIEKFQSIKQRYSNIILGDPPVLNLGDLVFRFTYSSDDEDLISPFVQVVTREGVWDSKNFVFDDYEFYSLMFDCMKMQQEHEFHFMHSDIKISSIQVVSSSFDQGLVHTPIADITESEEFISRLAEIEYSSQNDISYLIDLNYWVTPDKELAFKIFYENGDYEVFSHSSREEYRANTDSYNSNVYIGTFDSTGFYALIDSYVNN